jgi:hypothetical protein
VRFDGRMVQCSARQLTGCFMRFTIRDVLWLMVVAGLSTALALTTLKMTALRAKISQLEKAAQDKAYEMRELKKESLVYRFELEKALGESVSTLRLTPDPADTDDSRKAQYYLRYGQLTVQHSDPKGTGTIFIRD